jgi:AsmA protein
VVRGTFGLAKSPAGADFRAQLQFSDVDLEQCLGEMFGIRKLEGRGNLSFAIDSSGNSVYELTKALNGTATLVSRKGAIAGFNVEQLLKRIERRPLSGSGEFRTGKTPFETLAVNLKIVQGMAKVDDVRMEGPNVGLALTGSASIPERELDLRGTASLLSVATSGANAAAPLFELPFMVQGSWDDPIILPDPQSRIERSGAAQPILDAVRDRSSRDAVRSAIERLTRSAPAKPTTAAPAGAAPALAGASAPAEGAPAAADIPAHAETAPDAAQPSR